MVDRGGKHAGARRRERQGLLVEQAQGPAARAGVLPGDRIVQVNGQPVVDVLDLEFAAADQAFSMTLVRQETAAKPLARLPVTLALRRGEHHGVVLANDLGGPVRRCRNSCRFCFVDQLPPGLRASLRVKDDDYRLSFLSGNFITLSNLSRRDLARIARLRLSPLYVSLHAWNDERRVALMGPATRSARKKLLWLAQAGIEMHVQVVFCPGWNDGATLAETVSSLARVRAVADVGVVPVSLAHAVELRRVTRDDAERVVAQVEAWQSEFRRTLGRAFVHASDEFYLLSDRLPPASDAGLQYQNGVGIAAATLKEARLPARLLPTAPVALLTGTLAEPVVREVCRRLNDRLARARALPPGKPTSTRSGDEGEPRHAPGAGRPEPTLRPLVVENRLFGPHVTVTGLLGGRDVVRALREQPLADGEWLLAPTTFLPPELGVTIDDVPFDDLRAAAQGRLVVADGLAAGFAKVRSMTRT